MRPAFYSLWLEGSARKAPAQRHLLHKRPFCLSQRIFQLRSAGENLKKSLRHRRECVFTPCASILKGGAMSALGPLADIGDAADCSLFDHFVGDREQPVRDREAEPGGLEVDHPFECVGC